MRRYLLGAWVLLLAGCGKGPGPAAPERKVTIGHVFVIGLDGADWEIIDRLAASGRLPNLARLRAEGAHGVLRSEEPLLSPIVWTTIATGRSPAEHGIIGFLTRRNGVTEPVRSDERKVRAFWNIAGDLGATVGVIGWYASWPAEEVNGFLVSDRIGTHQVQGAASAAHSGLVYPPSLGPELDRLREDVDRDVTTASLGRFFPSAPSARGPSSVPTDKLDTLLGIVRTTEMYRRLVPTLMKRFDPDIGAVYFEGTDAVGHLFGEYAPPALPWVTADEVQRFGEVFDRYYMAIDEVVGEIVSTLDRSRTTLVIVSDHGFRTGSRRPSSSPSTPYGNQAPRWHRPEGILLMWGRGVRSGFELPESSIYDILPTMLRAADLPTSASLKGRPVDAAFTPELLARPFRSVDDFERKGEEALPVNADAPADEQIAKLRALGYIGGGETKGSGASREEGQKSIPLNRYNEAIVLLDSGRKAEAMAAFVALQRDEPRFALGFLGEALVHLQDSQPGASLAPLEQAARVSPQLAIAHAYLGEAYLQLHREDDALGALERALEIDGTQGRPALQLAQILLGRRRLPEAARWFEVARSAADERTDRARACIGLAILAEEQKRMQVATDRYREALSISPDFPPALERYGNLELFLGHPAHAVELLGRLDSIDGGKTDPRVLLLYAQALAATGKNGDAVTTLRRSLSADPSQPDARALLEKLSGNPKR